MSFWQAALSATVFLAEQFPAMTVPEIAFLGRSNVGKSTLLNALMGRRLAHVSGTPGKTRSINFFEIKADNPFRLVDLPGFGFAARGKQERDRWRKLIEAYILRRETLLFSIHLVDFRHGLLENDLQLQDWMGELGLPLLVVFTKVDKIARGKRKTLLTGYRQRGFVSFANPLLLSGTDGTGVEELRAFIEGAVAEASRAEGFVDQPNDLTQGGPTCEQK
ncbi:MAG: YihA family ribosome biogenesis GTP-binding protein [Synergistaceae bacterium]|nr:YihA family ribosome biogenesis GTP-binding protein [Synergistaceae bacterium]